MDTIFVAISSGGQYDESWQRNEVACLTEADVLAYIEQAKLKQQKRIKDFDDFKEADTQRSILLPVVEFTKATDIPKWKAGISENDITPEMRAERNEIIAKNDEIREQYMEHIHYRYEIANKFRKEFFVKLGYSEDDPIMDLDIEDDIEFTYEELKVSR